VQNTQKDIPSYPAIEIDLAGLGRSRYPMGISLLNPVEMQGGLLVMIPGSEPLINWALGWRYKLMVYNNSNQTVYNLSVVSVGDIHFTEMEMMKKDNHLQALDFKALTVTFEDWVECVDAEASEIMKPRYPAKFENNLRLKVSYYDEQGKEYLMFVEFKEGGIVNRRVG
jgi:hypothetical protein